MHILASAWAFYIMSNNFNLAPFDKRVLHEEEEQKLRQTGEKEEEKPAQKEKEKGKFER